MKTAIIGFAQTKFKEHWDKGLRELIRVVGLKAMEHSGLQPKKIDDIVCANALSGTVNKQLALNTVCYDELGIKCNTVINNGDCSGASAIRQALFEIGSGKSDVVMVVGVEKTTDMIVKQSVAAFAEFLDQDFESYNGATVPSIYAMMTKLYIERYNLKIEDLAEIPVINHKNSVDNKFAQFPFEIKKENVLNSSVISEPIKNLEFVAPCDGAAAIILCSEKLAKDFKTYGYIIGTGAGNDNLALHNRKELTRLDSTKKAADEAFSQAGIKPNEINIAEVHDITPISEILSVESLGFCDEGKGLDFIKDSKDMLNLTGGLKACGHPMAATGIRQAIDICKNLNKKNYGLTQTLTGSGSESVVNIFSSE